MRKLEFLIDDMSDGMHAADYLRRKQNFSYSLIVKLRHNPDSMILDGVPIRTIDPVRSGMALTVTVPEKGASEEPNFDMDVPVVYEDEDLIVFDKPPHMPVHPAKGHQTDTVANYCAAHYPDMKYRVIGRLDKDTSGLMIVAKNLHSAAVLTDSPIRKEYIAIASGDPEKTRDTIDEPIDDSDPAACRRFVGPGGKKAVTEYEVMEKGSGMFMARVMPLTGRTHQIRVHFSYMGHTLMGDSLYGGDTSLIGRHALHRSRISFIHPVTGKPMNFTSDIPDDMKKLLDIMREERK